MSTKLRCWVVSVKRGMDARFSPLLPLKLLSVFLFPGISILAIIKGDAAKIAVFDAAELAQVSIGSSACLY